MRSVLRKERKKHLQVTEESYPALPSNTIDFLGFPMTLTSRKAWKTYANIDKRGIVVFPIGSLLKPYRIGYTRAPGGHIPRRRSVLGDALKHVIILYCIEQIETRMPATARGAFHAFIHFEKYLVTERQWHKYAYNFHVEDIDRELLASYGRWLEKNAPASTEYLSHVRSMYRFGSSRGYPRFQQRILKQLDTIRMRTRFAGDAARFYDPVYGAFDFYEQQQIIQAFYDGKGADADRAVAGVFHQTGCRPASLVRLRKKHLSASCAREHYVLNVPRSKQTKPTNQTREHVIERWLGDLLCKLVPSDMPADAFLFHWLDDQYPTKTIRESLQRWSADANLRTIRVGDAPKTLPVTPYRFRRTLALNLASQGASPWTIAESLDDKSLGMAVIYTSNASTIVDTLAETLDRHPSWYRVINLFLGRLEDSTDKALPLILGGVPYLAEFETFAERIGAIGRCSLNDTCTLMPPLSCYRCPFFRAALDIKVHELQLDQLRAEIDKSTLTESNGVASAVLDDVHAILNVIAAIKDTVGIASHKSDRRAQVAQAIATAGKK